MESIENFKLKDFLKQDIELINSYLPFLEIVPPTETNSLFECSLQIVENCRNSLLNSNIDTLVEIIASIQKCKTKDIYSMPIITFYGVFNSIKNQLEEIINAEKNSLTSSHTNAKFEQVSGSKRLQKFGIYNNLNNLAKGDILKFKEILELPYSLVFTKLFLDKTNSDIEHDMNQIQTTKH